VFLATETPPRERFLVRVTLHMDDGPLYANAFVSRRVAPTYGGQVQSGVGVQFFAMPERAKRRWDAFISSLAGAGMSSDGEERVASFLVKLPDVDKLREFFERALRMQSLYMVTEALRPVGSRVAVVMIHPQTEAEFVLAGQISRVRVERPRGLEVKIDHLPTYEHASFGRFLAGEDPLAATPLPSLTLPDVDEEFALPGPETRFPRFPPELPPILRSSAPPPLNPYRSSPPRGPTGDLMRAVSVDLGGPLIEEGVEIAIEDSFEWDEAGEDLVLDVDLSAIEGEDLSELRAERGLRMTSNLPRVTDPADTPATYEDELPSELVDLASMMVGTNDPTVDGAATQLATPQKLNVVEKRAPSAPRVRRVSRPRVLTDDDDEDSEARLPVAQDPITGDLFKEKTQPPMPRRVITADVNPTDHDDEPATAPDPAEKPPDPTGRIKVPIAEQDTDRGTPLADLTTRSSPIDPTVDPDDDEAPTDVARKAHLTCRACHDTTVIETGPVPGELALLARHEIFRCRDCHRFVSAVRLSPPEAIAAARAKARETTVERHVPVHMLFDVADLATPPRCPTCTSVVRTSKVAKTIESAMEDLPAKTVMSNLKCSKCDHLGMVVEPVSAKPRSKSK